MSQLASTLGRLLVLTLPCELHAVRTMAKALRDFLGQHGLPPEHLDGWELAAVEAGNNAVRYAEGPACTQPVQVTVEVTAAWVEVRILDHTRGFDLPSSFDLPDPLSEGGRGLYLIHCLTDSIDYQRGRLGNCLVLRRHRPQLGPGQDHVTTPTDPLVLESTLQTMTEDLAASYESLSAIFRFTEDLTRSGVDATFVERWLLELKAITNADWFVLRLLEPDARTLRPFQALPKTTDLGPVVLDASAAPDAPATVEAIAATERHDVWFDQRRPLTPNDPLHRFGPDISGLVHPMHVNGELIGVLSVGSFGPSQPFNAGQVNILQTLADFLAIQIRDAQLQQARLQSSLLRRDFEVASDIQRRLLPKDHPSLGPWVTYGYCESAQRVGGDFYDILPINKSCVLLAVADVMGKGMPAALFATVFRTLLRARRDLAPRPGVFLEWLNRDLATDLGDIGMFITAQLAYVDFRTRRIRVAGAGHPPLIIAGEGCKTEEIPSVGPPLGVIESLSFRAVDRILPKRARVLMYTDGMTEVTDRGGDQIGTAPLVRILEESVATGLDATGIGKRLAAVQGEVAGDAPASDDRTFLLLVEEVLAATEPTLLTPSPTPSPFPAR